VADRLTPEQQAAFDDGPSIDRRLRPSGDQTPLQARNFAVDDFRVCCSFDGIPVPSVEAVEAAIAAAEAARAAKLSITSTVLPRTEFRDIHGKVVATATVGDDGVAVVGAGADARGRDRAAKLTSVRVFAPLKDEGPTLVGPGYGELYLRSLPFAFRSPYLHAVFLRDEIDATGAAQSAGTSTLA
jgi:hypothetical protein